MPKEFVNLPVKYQVHLYTQLTKTVLRCYRSGTIHRPAWIVFAGYALALPLVRIRLTPAMVRNLIDIEPGSAPMDLGTRLLISIGPLHQINQMLLT